MENAGRNVAAIVRQVIDRGGTAPGVAILCGGANNGGDGYVVARHLANASICVQVHAARDPVDLPPDAAVHAAIVGNMGITIELIEPENLTAQAPRWARAGVLVDALLGTGLKGQVRPALRPLIERINRRGPEQVVVAVDIPSGLDADTGQSLPVAVRADRTVTFVAPKIGFARPQARRLIGQLDVVDIGAPSWLVDQVLDTRRPAGEAD